MTIDIKKQQKLSWDWYQRHVRDAAARMNALKFLGDHIATQTSDIVPGDMVSFFYDPKLKDTLPYYDTFPMSLPFSVENDRFFALNLHYLHPRARATLFQRLLAYNTDDKLTPKAKIAFKWATIKAASNLSDAKVCVKQYLFKHVKSRFVVIPPKEWERVIWLPLERFKKATNETVWGRK